MLDTIAPAMFARPLSHMVSDVVQVAAKVGASPDQVEGIFVWGNHSAAQFPDARHATVAGRPVGEVLEDPEWLLGELINRVQTRGQTILQVCQVDCPSPAGPPWCCSWADKYGQFC